MIIKQDFINVVSDYGSVHYKWVKEVGDKYLNRAISVQSDAVKYIYSGRGKFARPIGHLSLVGLVLVGLGLAPVLANSYNDSGNSSNVQILGWKDDLSETMFVDNDNLTTIISDKPRDRVIEYTVAQGDTLSEIAIKFGVSVDTIRWENNLNRNHVLKPGQKLLILPVSGVRHKVRKGETIYSIAKKYDAEPQAMVDFPFNSFADDEVFALAVGQEIIVPEGVLDEPQPVVQRVVPQVVPNTVSGSGQFMWPTVGRITQGYAWYHQAIDVANRESPNIVAADSGRVTVAGWPDNSGYGNRVVVDHGNGYVTLYAHLSQIYVKQGQYVNRGEPLGRMGTTGRSTGIHLHFEIRKGSTRMNPLTLLK